MWGAEKTKSRAEGSSQRRVVGVAMGMMPPGLSTRTIANKLKTAMSR
jgi:hypothetical protein